MRSRRKLRPSAIAVALKSANIWPARSSTAAGSRITVYAPGGSSIGSREKCALAAALRAMAAGSRSRCEQALPFAQPELSGAMAVMENCAIVSG